MTLAEIIQTGVDNPECAFFVGTFLGNTLGIKLFFMLIILGILFKMLDKIAFEPLAEWVKEKIWKRK